MLHDHFGAENLDLKFIKLDDPFCSGFFALSNHGYTSNVSLIQQREEMDSCGNSSIDYMILCFSVCFVHVCVIAV